MIQGARTELKFERGKMPNIKFTSVRIEGQFEDNAGAASAIQAVLQAAGFAPLPAEPGPKAIEATPVRELPAPTSSFPPSNEVAKQESAPPVAPRKPKSLKPAGDAPPRKTVADYIRQAVRERGASMTGEEIFAAVKKLGCVTTQGSCYGTMRNVMKAGELDYDGDRYSATGKLR